MSCLKISKIGRLLVEFLLKLVKFVQYSPLKAANEIDWLILYLNIGKTNNTYVVRTFI